MATFFTSDTHAFHKNLCSGTTEWSDKSKTRPYDNPEEMTNALATVINNTVRNSDVLYHLGDWSFAGKSNIERFRAMLNVGTVHLILGNHDHHQKQHPESYRPTFASIQNYAEVVVEKQPIVLSHYAFRVWNDQNRGVWHLYGHSHGNLPVLCNKSLDVGVDGDGMHKYTAPWSMDRLRDYFLERNDFPEDHHQYQNNNHPFGDRRK